MGALRYKLLPYEDLDGPPMSKPSNNSSSDSLLSTTAPTHYDFTPIELAVSTSLFIGVILVQTLESSLLHPANKLYGCFLAYNGSFAAWFCFGLSVRSIGRWIHVRRSYTRFHIAG